MTKKEKVTQQDVKDVVNQTKSSKGVAEEKNLSQETVKKKVRQGKLNLAFQSDGGDKNPPPVESSQTQGVQGQVQLDYYATALGFITFIDTILWLVAKISRGNIEYQRLDKDEIEICANALKAETKVLEILASADWAMHIIVLMQLVGVFSTKIKIKKKEKKKKDEKPTEPTKTTMKKDALKDITKGGKADLMDAYLEKQLKEEKERHAAEKMGDATEVSSEVERNEEPISFLESKDVGDYDSSDKASQFKTPDVHDENYGNPPKDGKGLRQ